MFLITSLNAIAPGASSSNGTAQSLKATVPWIVSGNNVKQGHTISRKVSLLDTGATIMYALGLKTHTEWESHAVEEIFETKPEHRTTENEMPASLY